MTNETSRKLVDLITGKDGNCYEIEGRILLAKALSADPAAMESLLASVRSEYDARLAKLREQAAQGACSRWSHSTNLSGNRPLTVENHIGSNFQYDLRFPKAVAQAFGLPTKPLEDIARTFFDATLMQLRAAENGAGVFFSEETGQFKRTHYSWADTPEKQMAYELMQMARVALGAGLNVQESCSYLSQIAKELPRMCTFEK